MLSKKLLCGNLLLFAAHWLALLLPASASQPAPCYFDQPANVYLQRWGPPQVFVKTFPTVPVRRPNSHVGTTGIYETWMYMDKGIQVVFKNGSCTQVNLFNPRDAIASLPGTDLSPQDLPQAKSRDELEKRFGKPDEITENPLGEHTVTVLTYKRPGALKSFAFLDGHLNGVTAGLKKGMQSPEILSHGTYTIHGLNPDTREILGTWGSSFAKINIQPAQVGVGIIIGTIKLPQGILPLEGSYDAQTKFLRFIYRDGATDRQWVCSFFLSHDKKRLEGSCIDAEKSRFWDLTRL